MQKFFKSGFFLGFSAVFLLLIGIGVWGLLSDSTPTPLAQAVSAVTTPVQRAFTRAADWMEDKTVYFTRFDALLAENARLKAELLDAQADIRQARELQAENARLRQLLDMRRTYEHYELLDAEVIASDTGSWGFTYTLDRGSADGVAVDQCVLTQEGVVGRVVEVGVNWARISCITATDSRIGALVSSTREVGVLEGSFDLMRQGVLRFSYLPTDPQLRAGDTVETSGSGEVYPKGLIVGTVVDLLSESDGTGYYAILEPAVDLSSLTSVYILLGISEAP